MPSNWENMYRHNEELTAENGELRAELDSAQAVIDAVVAFETRRHGFPNDYNVGGVRCSLCAALDAHLEKYPR